MRPISSVVSGLVAVAALAGSAAGQDPSPRREQQVDSLFSAYTKDLSPGAAVAVVRDGKVLLTKG